MICEQYVSLETAKLTKEKRFNESCRECYENLEIIIQQVFLGELSMKISEMKNVSQAMLARWLREIRKVNVTIKFRKDLYKYYYEVKNIQIAEDEFVSGKMLYNTYEEAMEKGLQCALNHLR